MQKEDDQYSVAETARRMESAIRRAQKTPPTPHAKAKKKPSPRKAKAKKS
jgi:hypothetical protein